METGLLRGPRKHREPYRIRSHEAQDEILGRRGELAVPDLAEKCLAVPFGAFVEVFSSPKAAKRIT